jgi:hypothetical protein
VSPMRSITVESAGAGIGPNTVCRRNTSDHRRTHNRPSAFQVAG